jgi:cyclic nucleotide-binding protein
MGMAAITAKLPRVLQIQRLPLRVVLITALLSYALQVGAIIQGFPLYGIVGVTILPWILVMAFEYVWKYEHYGFYAFLLAFVLLQLGHLTEHTVQIFQLLATGGDLAHSHGVFGQLDFETVHVVWDSSVWIGLAICLYKFSRNPWLYVAFIFASLHEVEHLYLYTIYNIDKDFYFKGGLTGIMGLNGVIGSPLMRPYLHFFYNFLVVTPMLIAFVRQTEHAYDQYLAKALPDLGEEELVATSSKLERVVAEAGELIVRQDEPSDRFYILTSGEVELVVQTEQGWDRTVEKLQPGQFFGELGILTGRNPASARASKRSELLALDSRSFTELMKSDAKVRGDVEADMRRLHDLKYAAPPPTPAGT